MYYLAEIYSSAIDHRIWKTEVPVRSPILKPYADTLVVGSVTTSESVLLIVFANFAVPALFSRKPKLFVRVGPITSGTEASIWSTFSGTHFLSMASLAAKLRNQTSLPNFPAPRRVRHVMMGVCYYSYFVLQQFKPS